LKNSFSRFDPIRYP